MKNEKGDRELDTNKRWRTTTDPKEKRNIT